ncbi:MAG: NADH-quinone oxidoreductase subunit NuoH [Pirellulales bacterium]|nr:NADH-quinone oxidoreductase subunit NuoH [Pirellulales bacterium]
MTIEHVTVEALIKIVILASGVLAGAAWLVLVERWMAAWIQMRRGPNRVGIPWTNIRLFGLGQPVADGLKFIFKEEFDPAHVSRGIYTLAPIIMLVAALGVFAVVPFGSMIPSLGHWMGTEPIDLMIAPGIDVGIIYVFALSSLAVYGVILGGWASNNKYSLLGGLRSSAQLIAYELPLGLGILGVVLATGSLRLDAIIHAQATTGWWFVFTQPLGFVVFVVAAFAEAGRLPFDLPECEQELVEGYHTEYSGMKLMLFLTAEFIHMMTASVLIAILFLGGWHVWGMTPPEQEIGWGEAILRVAVLFIKTFGVVLFFMLVRWTWPRFRYDQLMALGWKVMIPLGILNLVAVAVLGEISRDQYGMPWGSLVASWGLLMASWLAVAWVAPATTDNRPETTD